MEPVPGYERPDPLADRASSLKTVFYPVALITFIPLFAVYFNFSDALIHPIALQFGKPATAIVSGKRISHGKHTAGNYLSLNYQYSPDYAPRPEVKVNWTAFNSIAQDSHVAIHYIPGCPDCVALDGDYGSALEQGIEALFLAGLIAVFILIQVLKGRRRERRLLAGDRALT